MPGPHFTTNPNEFTQLEGLYIFEKDPPGFIQGVSLSTLSICGETIKGPVDQAVLITSPSRFTEVFGGRSHVGLSASANQVREFLLNKPFGQYYVTRAAATAAATASFNAEDTDGGGGTEIVSIAASSPGVWGNDVLFKVLDATDGDANHWNLEIKYNGAVVATYENLNTTAGNDNLLTTIGTDLANFVVVTKLADGRPLNNATFTGAFAAATDADDFMALGTVVAGFTSVAGSDGTIADTDYTGTGRAIEVAARVQGAAIFSVAERANATVNAKVLAEAVLSSDRVFLIWNGSHTETVANVITDAALYRDDRIIYCYNSPKIFDFDGGVEINNVPHSFMASILSQNAVNVHPGSFGTTTQTNQIRDLQSIALTRDDYINLRAAGICAFEKTQDGQFIFVSGVTTDLTTGKTEITRRRSADFLTLSMADRLRFFVKELNTQQNRIKIFSEVTSFLTEQTTGDSPIVEDFAVQQAEVNTQARRDMGIEEILTRVKLTNHILHLILSTEIGTTVTISSTDA